eukprot:GILJ01000688.1.p1 GENE.GILJ01000688.1~~GILJ01000688.1.p1  ORF type:complete len:547 (-),score=78.12 GILJ01000688.1:117-1757(-)
MFARVLRGRIGSVASFNVFRSFSAVSKFATVLPNEISGARPGKAQNLVNGEWRDAEKFVDILDPLNGEKFLQVPDTQIHELQPFVDSLAAVPKSGLHNPLKNPERYLLYGQVCRKAASLLHEDDVLDYFIRLIQRVMPKSYIQARAEVVVTRMFLENFSGDQPRFLARSFTVAGDHTGQASSGYRWPYGPVAVVAPFNFPLEIPALQFVGALLMGNKPLVKGDSKVSIVLEQFVRFLQHCGMPAKDLDLIHADGPVMGQIIERAPLRMLQFTGSSRVADMLTQKMHGRIKVEDAGFDWKILGPDVSEVDYVAWVCDQDAYAMSGQKCSAQSMLFAHSNWVKAGVLEKIASLASRRSLAELTLSPIMSLTTERILDHVEKVLQIPGARLLMGGKALTGHSVPKQFGAVEPTAVFVPLDEMLKPENFPLVTTEIFGPFQIVTEYDDSSLHKVLEACERMDHHLTAAVVSSNSIFLNKVLGHTVNGTTYAGLRARTTGAPQNHWFGPCGDPRGAGIGTPEAIQLVWSGHREIIRDEGPIPQNWTLPKST